MSIESAIPPALRRRPFWLLLVLGAGLSGLCLFGARTLRRDENTPSLRGRAVATKLGCFACHGPEGRGGVVDPGARGKMVPGWDGAEVATLATNDAEVREWILDGMPRRLRSVEFQQGRKPLMPMPAYRGRLSSSEMEDLMVFFRAVSAFDTGITPIAYEGRVEATRQGCFACHGAGGVGGFQNDGSFKGHIPAWDGEEYPELVRSEAELREWIVSGHPKRLWSNPVARHFLERQETQMPAYSAVLSDEQVTKIAAYIQWRSETRGRPASYDTPSPKFPPETGRPALPLYRSPQSLCLSKDGTRAYVANYSAALVSEIDVPGRRVLREFAVGERPSQLALSVDGAQLLVSCSWAGHVEVLDLRTGKVNRTLTASEEPCGLVPLSDGRRLAVTNVVANSVTLLDLATGARLAEVPVGSQPRFAVETPDHKRLLVANGLSPWVSVIDVTSGRETGRYDLGRASMLRGIVCSNDGRWAFVANLVSHNEVPTVQMERGWINSNGFTILDLAKPGRRVTLLLDTLFSGATNPSGVAVSRDGRRLYVTLAGIHELAIVDLPAALALAAGTPDEKVQRLEEDVEILAARHIARRVPAGGLGPRSVVVNEAAGELLVANYFSDSVSVLDSETGAVKALIQLGPVQAMSEWRKGELMANDGRITYQNWLSCTSCHQEDTTSDGLNWDLSNDGIGNPKNNKSLQDAHDTPPVMWSGVRMDLPDGVGAGERFQGFVPMASVQGPISEYLGHPDRAPSPYCNKNQAGVARGKVLFTVAGCDICHPGPTFSDCKFHDLGFSTPNDYRSRFDTPSLRSCYRTAPYLHDGRAPTLQSIFTEHNPGNLHGRTKGFTAQEIEDLVAYIQTL